jgi:phi13 family phage major tail protein
MYDSGEADPPYFALGYRLDRPNDVSEYAWLLKGKFAIPKEDAETKAGEINEKTLSVEYTAVTTIHKFQLTPINESDLGKRSGAKAVYADTSDASFIGKDTWFTAVVKPPEIVVE